MELFETLWKDLEKDNRKNGEKEYTREQNFQNFYVEKRGDVPVVRFSCFDAYADSMQAGFSTRFGGVSEGCFSSMNLGFGRGDKEDNVQKNYKRICHAMNVDYHNLVLSDQVHDTRIKCVTKEDTCQEKIQKKLQGIDGLVTNQENLVLATSYADCVPLFFYDPIQNVVASSHSGWRGTVGKIGAKTVALMQEQFHSCSEDIIVLVGPSICQDCYEVSKDLYDAFLEEYKKEVVDAVFSPSKKEKGKYHLDLWGANYYQLLEAGIKKENLHIAGICTCCHSELFFSHRASQGKRGNLNGFITIK